jgi:hypothetical protein
MFFLRARVDTDMSEYPNPRPLSRRTYSWPVIVESRARSLSFCSMPEYYSLVWQFHVTETTKTSVTDQGRFPLRTGGPVHLFALKQNSV